MMISAFIQVGRSSTDFKPAGNALILLRYNSTRDITLRHKGASQLVDDVPPVGGHPGSLETPFAPARNRLGEAASLVNSIEFRDRIPRNGAAVHCPDLLFHLPAGICVLRRGFWHEKERRLRAEGGWCTNRPYTPATREQISIRDTSYITVRM